MIPSPVLLPVAVSLRHLQDSNFLPSFPPAAPLTDSPFPPRGPLERVPPLQQYYEEFRLPTIHPNALRFLRLSVPHLRRVFAPAGTNATPAGLDFGEPGPIRHSTRRSWDLPGSCGILVLMPRSSTPVRLPRLAIPAVPCCLPLCARRRLSRFPFFRGSFTQPVHSLCTLRSSGRPETTQHSVLGRWLAFAGRGSHPLDTYARFQSFLHHVPLAQAFLAHAHHGVKPMYSG